MKRSCKKTRINLMPYLTGRIEEKDSREVREHLSVCPECSREAADLHAAWERLEIAMGDETFKDITPNVLHRIKSAECKTGLMMKLAAVLTGTPAPALGTLIVLLALPAGIYLGKNLYRVTALAYQPAEEITASPEELPLDIFSDFPDDSIGGVYMNLDESG